MRTIEVSKDNALNLIRLILAMLVIVSHAFPIGGFGSDPAVGDLGLGHFAVGGFFAISGYLITKSRFQSNLPNFMRSRALRILPGYWACLLFTAFPAAGLASIVRGTWSLSDGLSFLLKNAVMIKAGGGDIGTTLVGAEYTDAWNGSLWTLRYEFACYVAIGLLLLVPKMRTSKVLFLWALGLLTVVSLIVDVREISGIVGELGLLVPFFVAGAAAYVYTDRIPALAGLAASSAIAILAVSSLDLGHSLAAIPTTYLMLYLGNSLPQAIRGFGRKTDISYGTYLYAFPVQQLLVLAGAHELGVAPYIALSILCTLPLAYMSFVLVERPALQHKKRLTPIAALA